jgi:heterodisulfide reductase subunit A
MEAAACLIRLGHEPVLVERERRLGGHVASWFKLFPDMSSASELVENLKREIHGHDIRLNTGIISVNRLKDEYIVVLSDGNTLRCAAILLATGFKLFDATRKEEYGYGVYDHVITNSDLEAWFSGKDDKRVPPAPKSAGFVHCVGSRDLKAGNSQCSKVCCTTAIKQAIEFKERFPEAEVYCFYMDLRLFGKKYEDFYINAQTEYGIHFIRGRVSEVGETIDGRVQVKAEDTLNGTPVKVSLDLLVLMSGMCGNPDVPSLARMLRLDVDSDGFFRSADNISRINDSNRPGIFYAGAATGTKTVPETLAEARAAALEIHDYLGSHD